MSGNCPPYGSKSIPLLSLLGPEHHHYTVLDLKDAFFCIPLAHVSQPIFAFEWSDPDTGVSGQLTWTRLPQGFKNPPTLFDEALSQDLAAFQAEFPQCSLPYSNMWMTYSWLKKLRRPVSAKKAQLCQPKVTYLGYIIVKGNWVLAPSQVQVVLQLPTPTMKHQVREFLGAVGYCRLWILGFAKIVKPLYACTGGNQPLTWTEIKQ
ncbi:Gag-Pol polyprotein [Plecturocebus cupreus]